MTGLLTLLSHMSKSCPRARIVSFSGSSDIVERLQELGLRVGLEISYSGMAPFNGPLMFRVGGTVIALRKEEAACTQITAL